MLAPREFWKSLQYLCHHTHRQILIVKTAICSRWQGRLLSSAAPGVTADTCTRVGVNISHLVTLLA